MPEYDPVAKISIIPRGQAGGLTFFAPSEERLESGLYSRSYLENQMAVALGGRSVFHPFKTLCFSLMYLRGDHKLFLEHTKIMYLDTFEVVILFLISKFIWLINCQNNRQL